MSENNEQFMPFRSFNCMNQTNGNAPAPVPMFPMLNFTGYEPDGSPGVKPKAQSDAGLFLPDGPNRRGHALSVAYGTHYHASASRRTG